VDILGRGRIQRKKGKIPGVPDGYADPKGTKMAKSEDLMSPKTVKRFYKNRVALPDDVKRKVVDVMNVKLAASLDMYSQAKYAHWNVKGVNFYQLHLVFDDVAKTIFKQIDAIAERITQLGGTANGTVRMSAANSPISPYNVEALSGPDHVTALADSLGEYCKELRKASDDIDELKDEPTADFFKQLVVDAEEELYFLESHLEAGLDVQ
jgi:starvation-inducible DNA-binding protein